MAASDVKILGAWPSPFVMRPRLALALKNIDYEFLVETFAPKSELLLKSNPIYKKIPVMIHKDKPICESLIIVEYIEEVFTSAAPSLLPSDPYDRAVARFWATYIDDKLFTSVQGSMRGKTDEEKASSAGEATAGLVLLEEAFEKISKGKGFFGGERIGYLDIALGSHLGWIRVAEKLSGSTYIDESRTPGLYGWAGRFCADAAVKDLMPEPEKLFKFAKMLMSGRFGDSKK